MGTAGTLRSINMKCRGKPRRGNSKMYLTLFYLFVFSVVVSSFGGFLVYKISNKFSFPRFLKFIFGGLASLLLSYLMINLWFYGAWFSYVAIIGLMLYGVLLITWRKKM
jgi:hypothetical protein